MRTFRTCLIAIALSLGVVAPASAQDLQKGFDAYDRGNYTAALREWRLLAEQGYANAQIHRGVM